MIDYLSSNLWLIWLVVAVVGLIAELMTGGFVLVCFALAALVTAVLSPVVGPLTGLFVFSVCSVVFVVKVRPFVKKYLHPADRHVVSNADAICGKEGVVVDDIPDHGFGRVMAGGDNWKAKSADGSPLAKGQRIVVARRESIVLTVTKL